MIPFFLLIIIFAICLIFYSQYQKMKLLKKMLKNNDIDKQTYDQYVRWIDE